MINGDATTNITSSPTQKIRRGTQTIKMEFDIKIKRASNYHMIMNVITHRKKNYECNNCANSL